MSDQAETTTDSPWHEGERALQRRAGVAERMDATGRHVLRSFLLDQHRAFYPLLPFIVIGAVDREGEVWATARAGLPGFVRSPDPLTLEIRAGREAADPAEAGMEDGDAVGLLGIDLMTRRRNRLNGTIRRQDADGFAVSVGQSFGNCPRYIQNRSYAFRRDPAERTARPATVLDALDDRAREIVAAADSFFVASYVDREGGRQVDVSHRGGKTGFVRLDADGGLTVPDFSGNLFFNTLGNFVLNPRAGLLFVDHATGGLLQMTGRAEVVLDSPEIAAFEGAERLWRFLPRKVVHRPEALPLAWSFEEGGWSPSSLMTGSWEEAGKRLAQAGI
jgi:predicted pyridoxine 5'-phosphate oxidase superfamily flavin-nucleotide-binding protein